MSYKIIEINRMNPFNKSQIPNQESSPLHKGILLVVAFFCIVGIVGATVWYNQYRQASIEQNGGGVLPSPKEDLKEPTTPSGVTAIAISGTEVRLSWNASTDDVGVVGYEIYRDGSFVGESKTTTFPDRSTRPDTEYGYVITAIDAIRHASLASDEVFVKTPKDDDAPPANGTDTIPIQTSSGERVMVKNFYKDVVEISGTSVFVRDTSQYTLIYFPAESAFLITLNDSNVHTARAVAEFELVDILGISQQDLCRLAIFITIPFDVSETYGGKSYSLSFCPNGDSF